VTREEKDEQIWLYAAGALDAAEAESVRRLLAQGDPSDAATFAEATATVAHLPEALDQVQPPPGVRLRVLSRATSESQNLSPSSSTSEKQFNWTPWLAALAALVAILFGLQSYHLSSQLKHSAEANDVAKARLRAQLLRAKNIVAMLSARDLEMVSLAADGSKASGRVLWDKDHNQWHVSVFNLTPPTGRVLELWFITPDQKKIPGGTFTVDASGEGSMVAKVPADLKNIALAAITDEPPGGMPQPTGQIRLAGKVE